MALAAAAAYETVGQDFAIDTLHTCFTAGPKFEKPLDLEVQRLNDGGRFCTRVVTVKQSTLVVVHVTCSFVRFSAMTGTSMTHAVRRATSAHIDQITLDDLEPGRDSRGPYMKFQRLSVTPHTKQSPENPASYTYTSAAHLSTPTTTNFSRTHALGIIALSDYHVLDAPLILHGIPHGQPAIGDHSREPQPNQISLFTSLNHTIRFHMHENFRADEMCFIEVRSPWTAKRRAEVQSRIFTSEGKLVASCVQGSYYVMKEGVKL